MDNNEIRKQMELDQKRAFCKQSCTKIDQGLDRLDPRSGERAIWELFQNARDLARRDINGDKTAHIKISLTPTEFIFAHQGQPFDHDSLTSLVMQVSSRGKENDDTVGQYGTGFLTTHVFGRKLHVTGSLDMGKYTPGTYADINRFVIDRTYGNITEFVDKVAHQLLAVNEFADAPKTDSCREWTELCYDLSSMECAYENAVSAIASSLTVIPYVMTVNKPISDVTIENKQTNDIYQFEKRQLPDEEGLKVMSVSITHNGNREERKVYYIESESGEDMAILPLESPYKAKSLSGIAKLFVYFPLLGTENFGMDAIFHSKRFIPVEERDGLHLPVTNANVRAKYEQNIQVLDSLTEMVHRYYREHTGAIAGWVNISGLSFDCEHHKEDVTKDYFRTFKKKWSDFFQSLPMVNYGDGKISINGSNIRFFSQEIISDILGEKTGEVFFAAIYDAAVLTSQLVSRDEIIAWSKVVASWDELHPSLIGVEEIAHKLGECENVSISILHAFDSYVSQKGLSYLFDTNALIPNRDGIKKKRSELHDASAIPEWLGCIAKELVPDKIETFADDTFIGLAGMTSFTRNDLRDAINSRLRSLRQVWLEKGNVYESSVVETLLKLSFIFPSETASIIRKNTIKIIEEHLGTVANVRILAPNDSNERDIAELPFKHLVECMLLEISQQNIEWVANNIEYIVSLHSSLSGWAEYYNRNNHEGLCLKYGAFPNRNGYPSLARDLENGIDIPDELSTLYQEVMGKDLNDRMVDNRFEAFCDFMDLSAKDVAGEIEKRLEENGFQDPAVLDIINNIDKDVCWERWFPHIAAHKAELFLNHVREDCKESVFKLMKINDPDKLEQLAGLADEIDLDEIINKGRAALICKRNREADFNFKLELGKYVERMIQQHLSDSIIEDDITVETEQYGSDLSICKNGNPLYFIEVKSRWGKDQSVMMSPLQMAKSVKEADNYALCCVDMSHLRLSDEEAHSYPPVSEIFPLIKVLPNIGDLNKEVSDIANGEKSRLVHIGGDFKCVIPQETIRIYGVSFTSLIDNIMSAIRQDQQNFG